VLLAGCDEAKKSGTNSIDFSFSCFGKVAQFTYPVMKRKKRDANVVY